MAQTTSNDAAADEAADDPFAASEFARWANLAARLCQEGVRRQIAEDLAAGHAIPYAGSGSDAGNVFRHLPDGRRVEVRIHEDGRAEIVRHVP